MRTAALVLFATTCAALAGCETTPRPAPASTPESKPAAATRVAAPYQISLLKIPVSDIKKSSDFYRDVLGFTPSFVSAEYGWAQFNVGDISLALYKPGMGGGDGKIGGTRDFHLSASDLPNLEKRLRSNKALVGSGIQRGDDGSSFLEVVDPDGNTFKIGSMTPRR